MVIHHSALAKLQPAHSVTPSVAGSSTPGTPLSSTVQPVGGVSVQAASLATPSSTFGPSSRLLKSSVKTRNEPGLSNTANRAGLLVADPAELLTTTVYEPAFSSETLDNSSTGPSAPAISVSPLNHL